ncbi:MAG: hypothetical protein NVSMB25_17100 [Thermoleophilaceae bacterium]
MYSVFRKDRPADQHPLDVPPAAQVYFDTDLGDWCVTAACESCGGYTMALQVDAPDQRDLAESRAQAFVTRVHARGGCLGCDARAWRERRTPRSGDAHVWWDTETGQWMAWSELPGVPDGISLPLGIRTFWAPQEVRAAVRALISSERLPLRVAAEAAAIDDEASTIHFDSDLGRWMLRVACFGCGGFELPLTSFGRGAVEAACDEALGCLDLVAREGCPHCRTRCERDAVHDADQEPRIWFDTETRDWLVWQALEDYEEGVTLPLGIGRFDARRAAVYRAAASLLFDSELFHDEGL